MSEEKPWPDYSFLAEAAAEAREASRRYWAKGGAADRKYPQQPMPWWAEVPPDLEVIKRRKGRKWFRQGT